MSQENPFLDEEVMLFNSAEYGGRDSDDEADDREEMWLPVCNKVDKYDLPEAVDEAVCERLDIGEELTRVEKERLMKLPKQYSEVFATPNNRLGFSSLVEHRIDTGDAAPIKEQLRHFSFWQQQEIAKQVQELLEIGAILPCESDWAANVFGT